MKKQNAIIALLLILSLLVSSMTIFVSAQTTAGDTDSNITTGATNDTEAEQTLQMIETLVSSKTGTVDALKRPVYMTDKPNALVTNLLDGKNVGFVLSSDNQGSGYGILDVYDIKYGDDEFIRFNVSAAGLEANGGKIKRDVKISLGADAYGYFDITTVPGNLEATLGSADGYFVYDYEFTTEYMIPTVYLMPIVRAGRGGSYSLATQINLSFDSYAKYMNGGKWAHFTIIGDIKNNAMYVFVNGVLASSSKIISKLPDATVEYDSLRIEGMRISTSNVPGNAGMNLYMDNIAARYYSDANAALTGLDAALANKDISKFTEHYADKGNVLPPIAEVDGLIYHSSSEVAGILSGNTDTPHNVNILRSFPGIVNVNADSVINTRGFVGINNFAFPEGTYYEMEDGYITVDVPYVANSITQKPSSSADYVSAMVSAVEGNMATAITSSPSDNILVLTNLDDGKQCVEFLGDKTGETFVFVGNSGMKLVDYPYGVVSFDLVAFSDVASSFWFAGRGDSAAALHVYNFSTLLNGISVGEVAQFTIAFGPSETAGTYNIYLFRNGELINTNTFKTSDPKMYIEALRLQKNSGFHYAIDNLYSQISATTVFDADGNLLDEFNQFNKPGYEKLSLPSVATIDGVAASHIDQVSAMLDANALVYQQSVSINHKFTGTIKVNVRAVIETNGFVGLDSFEFGKGVDYVQVGTKIITKAPLDLADKVTASHVGTSGFTFPLAEVTTSDNQFVSSITVPGGQNTTYLDISTVTNAYDGSKYYGITTNPDYLANSTTADPNKYIAISINKTIKVDTSAGSIANILKTADEQYLVFDIDLLTHNRFFGSFDITNTPRWASDTNSNIDFASSNGLKITEKIGKNPTDWVHITAVYDVRNNVRYIYVNGEYSFTASFVEKTPPTGSNSINLQQIRLNIPAGVTLAEDMSLYFDNVSMREFDASETALIEAINNKSTLTTWDKNHAGKGAEGDLTIVASVDGQAFSSIEEAVKYALENKAKQLSIYDEYTGVVEITHDISIYVMNGKLNYVTNTHTVTVENGLYTFTEDKSALNTVYVVYDRFTFEDNGGIGGYEVVKYGSGSQFRYDDERLVKTTYYNGKYYTFNGKWAYETNDGPKEFNGVVTSDCNFKLLIPQYDTVDAECMFSYKLNGGEITLANSVDELKTLLNGAYETLEITIYEDIKYSNVGTFANIDVTGALTINLNGNDLTFTQLANAGFALVKDNSSLELKSAKAGANVYYSGEAEGALASGYLVSITANGCSLTVNGKNVSVYAGGLVSDNGGSGNTVTVVGGTFYRTLSAQYSYVTITGGMSVDISGATLVDTANGGVWFATASDADTLFDGAEINVNKTTVIGLDGNALIREAQDKNGMYVPMSFTNLTYVAKGGKLSYDENVSDAVAVGAGTYTNIEIPADALADGLKLLYQNKDYNGKFYYPAYVNGSYTQGTADSLDYTLTESLYSATTVYKVGSPYALNIDGMKYNLTLYSHFNINLYIPVSETAKFVTGTFADINTTVIDGVEYYVITESVNANSIGDDVIFAFTLVNNEAYVVTLNIVEYASNILANTSSSDTSYTPQLMVAMLEYASSVYAFEGKDNSAILEIVEAYEQFKVTTDGFGATVDTAPLAQFLSSASMYLNDSPSFIFKLKDDFVGTVKVECANITNVISSSEAKTILLGGVRITNIQDTITLTFTPEGGEAVVCTYNLATYYQGVSTNDAASILLNALRNYSNVANTYMDAAN